MELILKQAASSSERDQLFDGHELIGWIEEVRTMKKGSSKARLPNGFYTIGDPFILLDAGTEGKKPQRGISLTLANDELPDGAASVGFRVYSTPCRSGILYPTTFRRIVELTWLAGILNERISIRICRAKPDRAVISCTRGYRKRNWEN